MAPQFMLVANTSTIESTMTAELTTTVGPSDVNTTPIAVQAVLMTIAILPLVFLASLILGVYISLRRHTQHGTYGIAPVITITQAKSKKKRSHTLQETSSSINIESSQYGTLNRLTAQHPSDWSISSDYKQRSN